MRKSGPDSGSRPEGVEIVFGRCEVLFSEDDVLENVNAIVISELKRFLGGKDFFLREFLAP